MKRRNKFSLSHYKLFTGDMGWLIPCGCFEVLPGDTIQQSTSALIRVSPLLAPVMHPVQVRIHHWYVPYRLVWDNWEDFITGGPSGTDTSAFPVINETGSQLNSLADYFGIPPGLTANPFNVSALPFRAYNLIWNEWYRDQDLQAEIVFSKASGADSTTPRNILFVGWEKDYFTLARPWPQKGPSISIPVGTPGNAFLLAPLTNRSDARQVLFGTTGNNLTYTGAPFGVATNTAQALTGGSINDLREAFALQRFAEARARYGSRFTEYLAYLGVRSSDSRLQRPEYLGGGKQTIQFSEVLQHSPDAAAGATTNGVGKMAGHGITAMRSNRYRRFIEEHGVVISLFSVRPKTIYVQGVPRMWSKRIKEDFWQKELENIGQQEILNTEILANHTSPGGVFGYQDRYDEYRRCESTVAGEFRSTLDYWHMARLFASDVTLNADFVKSVPTKRIHLAQTPNVLWIMANHSIQARRLLSHVPHPHVF